MEPGRAVMLNHRKHSQFLIKSLGGISKAMAVYPIEEVPKILRGDLVINRLIIDPLFQREGTGNRIFGSV